MTDHEILERAGRAARSVIVPDARFEDLLRRRDRKQRNRRNAMERHDTTEAICPCCRRIPISHLSLDLDEPIEGWESFLAERGVIVMADALGRRSIARHILRDLLDERREREARLASEQAEKAAAAAQRPTVAVGLPAKPGLSAYETMVSQPDYITVNDELGRPPPRFLEEAIEEGQRRQAAEREAVRRRKEAK